MFELDLEEDPDEISPGDLIAFDPAFPTAPLVLRQASPEALNQAFKLSKPPTIKRGRTMGAHRFLRGK